MSREIKLSRREFLKISAAAGGGLLIGFYLPGCGKQEETAKQPMVETVEEKKDITSSIFMPNAWIRIDTDDSVNVMVASSEMGQGVLTSIPMLIAEELDADWTKVHAQFAPANEAYANPLLGRQQTGGSTAIRGFWRPVREAGAIARDVLISAAAQTWGVEASTCRTEQGAVLHAESGRRLRYGELANTAATLPVPDTAFLKEPKEFRIIGQSQARLDTPAKVNGKAKFGQDIKVPDSMVATVLRCPVFGGTVKSFDADKTRQIKGVQNIVQISSGIAVVADGFWPAKRGRDALQVEWDEGENAKLNSGNIRRSFIEVVDNGKVAREEGDVKKALGDAAKKLAAVYEVPYLAHACMEPMNCTAHVREDGCDIWVPTQAQTTSQQTGASISGLPVEKVKVHTTFLGGGFGRRGETDFVADAVEVSKKAGVPVKVIWTREDDMQHDYYRPSTYNKFAAALDDKGMPVAWEHRIAGPSIMSRVFPGRLKDGIDNTSVEGAANIPYGIPNIRVTYSMVNTGVPVGFWRSVGSSQNAYVTECFLDEVAVAGGQDPFELRQRLLADHPRHKAVLELAADKAGWGKPLPEGHFRGIAVAEAFASFVAQVAEVSIENKRLHVHKVVCAVDCGITVNPNTIEAQMQSGIVYGLTAALKDEILIKNGRVVQSNFNDYPMLRINEMPIVEVFMVQNTNPPGGIGEPGVPPIAPAVANAVFAATGQPVRQLPIRLG